MVSVRLCHAGQNVLIVHNCLFNENIPLAAVPSPPPTLPGLPPWLFVPTQRGKWPAALLFENCPAVKVAVTFSQCFPGLISSVLSPRVSLADSSPPARPVAASGTSLLPHPRATDKPANRLPLFCPATFYSTSPFFILRNPINTRSEYMQTSLKTNHFHVFLTRFSLHFSLRFLFWQPYIGLIGTSRHFLYASVGI